MNRYVMFFFAIYDPSERKLKYVNAGDNPPVVLRAGARIAAENARKRSAANVLSTIFAAADRFTGTAPKHDDVTLLVIQHG